MSPPPVTASVALPSAAASVSLARGFVQRLLARAGLDEDLVDTAVLLTSELVTNAVLHANGVVEVGLVASTGRGVRVKVRDRSDRLPVQREHAADSTVGRGLELVDLLAAAHGVRPLPDHGKEVWFALGESPPDLDDPRSAPGDQTRAGTVTVAFLGLPLMLYDVMVEHNEALLREYALYCLQEGSPHDSAALDVSIADRARHRIVQGVHEAVTAVRARGRNPLHLDVEVTLDADDIGGFVLHRGVFGVAEDLAAAGALLTLPALPEIRDLRDWCVKQIVHQSQGRPASRWAYREDTAPVRRRRNVDVDTSWVTHEDRPLVLGDPTNRILAVSGAAAQLLGWDAAALVGRRITTIVPPELREAHVAGFTRHLLNGTTTILGRTVAVAALHRDGHHVPIFLTLERRPAGDDVVFLAWMEPRDVAGPAVARPVSVDESA